MKYFAFAVLALAGVATENALAGERGTDVILGDVKSTTPASWSKAPNASKLTMYQFVIPKGEGDKEDGVLKIFHFGANSGGGTEENLKRWKSFFEAPEGKTIDDVAKVEKMKVGEVPVTYLDVHGTFLSKFPPFAPNAKITRKENYRQLSVIFQNEGGPYFITLNGPARTIEENKAAFDRWLKNFK